MEGLSLATLPWQVVLGIVIANVVIDAIAGDILRDPATGRIKLYIALLSALNAAIAGMVASYLPQEHEDYQMYTLIVMGIFSGPAINYIVEIVSSAIDPAGSKPKQVAEKTDKAEKAKESKKAK
ncbi:hypothetical protein AC1031_019371 [Aphanomyces cochlioides]|nr:hypothetical protein AC1031_019371 [Aphanomyces cochlioides]